MEIRTGTPTTEAVTQQLLSLGAKITNRSDRLGLVTYRYSRRGEKDHKIEFNGELLVDNQGDVTAKIRHYPRLTQIAIADSPQSHIYISLHQSEWNKRFYTRNIYWTYIIKPLSLGNADRQDVMATAQYDQGYLERFNFGENIDSPFFYRNGSDFWLVSYGKSDNANYTHVLNDNGTVSFDVKDQTTQYTAPIKLEPFEWKAIIKAASRQTTRFDLMFNKSYRPQWLNVGGLLNIQRIQAASSPTVA